MTAACRFAPLREHVPSECPLCNPKGWMLLDPPPASTSDPI